MNRIQIFILLLCVGYVLAGDWDYPTTTTKKPTTTTKMPTTTTKKPTTTTKMPTTTTKKPTTTTEKPTTTTKKPTTTHTPTTTKGPKPCTFWDVCNNYVDGQSFTSFGAVFFGNFQANTGDIQGSLAVGGDASFGNGGFSIDNLNSDANSLVVGGTLNGSPVVAPPFLICSNAVGCLNSFHNAKLCYISVANNLLSPAATTTSTVQFSALQIDCAGPASQYYVNVPNNAVGGFDFTYITVGVQCSPAADYILRLPGGSDLTFAFDTRLQHASGIIIPSNQVAWVFGKDGKPPCTRNITIQTSIAGSILAPEVNIVFNSGVVEGKVVACNFVSYFQSQINICVPVLWY